MSGGNRLTGRFRLEARIAEGPGTTLWRATDELLERRVAVRTLRPDGPAGIGTVMDAVRAAGRIIDFRFAKIFDAWITGDSAHVITEWPDGRSLRELRAMGRLGRGQAVRLVAEAAEALAGAHAEGLAHLCLGPDSVIRSESGEVKIFGLGVEAALSRRRAADPGRADVEGLARLLCAAVTGHWPTTPATPSAIAGRPHGGVPGDLGAIIDPILLPGHAASAITHPAQFAEIVKARLSAAEPAALEGRGSVRLSRCAVRHGRAWPATRSPELPAGSSHHWVQTAPLPL